MIKKEKFAAGGNNHKQQTTNHKHKTISTNHPSTATVPFRPASNYIGRRTGGCGHPVN